MLVRHGFGDLLSQLGIPRDWLNHFVPENIRALNAWQRMRVACEALGPTFVKFGQVLSTRPDLLPEPMVEEFRELRSHVSALPWEKMEPILGNELGESLDVIFSRFDKDPLACGSIGQVYRAQLASSGEEVVVKVQRPGIRKAVAADLEILGWLAKQLDERVKALRPYGLPDVIEATRRSIFQELDFSIEARNAMLFNKMNPRPDKVFAPVVIEEISNSHVMVSEYVEGVEPGRDAGDRGARMAWARAGVESIFSQIMIEGFFHADPHSGNIIISKDGRVCFVDWGIVGLLTREMRFFLADFFDAVSSLNAEKVVHGVMLMSLSKKRIETEPMEQSIMFILRQYQTRIERNEDWGQLLVELFYTVRAHGVILARDYTLLAKAIISIEDVGRGLSSSFDIREVAEPYMKKLAWERWNPANLVRHTVWSFQTQLSRLREIPGDLQRLFARLEDGDVKIQMEHRGLEDAGRGFQDAINRLVIGLIIAALIIGAGEIIGNTMEPGDSIFQYPTVLGTACYGVAMVLMVWLVFDVFRSR